MILGIFLSSSFSSFASSLAAAAISLVLENLPTLAWAYTTSAEVKRFEEELESVVSTAMEAETMSEPTRNAAAVTSKQTPNCMTTWSSGLGGLTGNCEPNGTSLPHVLSLRPQAEIQPVPVEEAPPPFSAPPPGLDQCLSSCSG
ncbi:hypothetical protein PF002_g30096 [Phytophthora fragariae]|uniref:Uncharacterized protein n=1 Tax=Phytophthora fragariae TaxID=53985 RepID=A0A6A3VSM3_9STRA|nr:hypothetical protein PF002_g30096 [Phytophthora fragariae]